jgi:prepilin-type N-terminal cleavage/methylation domain-containing protein
MKKMQTKKGFTLIEILVVVSIISLLAAVVVSGLTDARSGAKNSKRNEIARQYVISLGLYQSEYGQYPEKCSDCGDNTQRICLGSGYPGGVCYVLGDHSQNNTINTKIAEFIPGTPASLDTTIADNHSFVGISYKCVDTNCLDYEISWILEGSGSDAQCFGGATKQSANSELGICTYSSSATASN